MTVAADSPPPAQPLLAVPAYFHPAIHPDQWRWLAEHPERIRLVVLNIASGPGTAPQACFQAAADLLHRAGVCVIGYVDTGYGRREPATVLAELARYQDWYGVRGVCLDQVATGAEDVSHYAGLADRVRAMGAELVFFNHGAYPVSEYARHADLLGTFEGTWAAYERMRAPDWARRWLSSKFYHVVHSVPAEQLPAAWQLATRRHADTVYITERGGPNPYDRLPKMSGIEVRMESTCA